jgi:NADH-quinone oxidoreductase subunit H
MVVTLCALAALLVALGAGSYLLAGFAAGVSVRLGGPPEYGAAVANLITLMLVVVMITAALLTVAERKWSAMMQDRMGPNRIKVLGNALGGMPFLLADALKMLTKENVQPEARSRALYNLAPILAFAPIFALFAVVPVGPKVQVLGYPVALQVASPDAGLLYVFAIASLAVYGTTLAGWASNNKLAMLGGVRASSQMISYEVSLGLSLVGTMIIYRSLRLEEMVAAQGQYVWGWMPALGILLQPVGFLVFFASAFAETKRAPFDLPEGESEIIGYFIEYSGMKFGMFMLSEFVEVVILAGIIAAIFLGGGHPLLFSPERLREWTGSPLAFGAASAGIFLTKVLLLCYLQFAIRWALPRFRYDQVQRLCWKMLLPTALANVFLTAVAFLVDRPGSLEIVSWIGLAEIVGIAALTTAAARAPQPAPGSGGSGQAAHAAGH